MVRLIIGADIVPTASNAQYFMSGDAHTLIGDKLKQILNEADFAIFNLEVPLTDVESPIEKCGPNLIAPVSTVKGLAAITPHFFTLANNHILDQGEQGLFSTMQALHDAGIAFAGVGKNLEEAQRPYIFTADGLKIGIYCCAEHEFSIATEDTAGANPFDPLESLDHIYELKKLCDYVLVLYHGGKEHYRYPSPYLQKACRKMIDKGADLVVCQHSHCIGCEEEWRGGRIVYGQGNFLFDDSASEFWQTGLLIGLEINKENGVTTNIVNYIPIRKFNERVRLAEGKDKSDIICSFKERSSNIPKPYFIENNYMQFAQSMCIEYLSAFAGRLPRRFLYRAVNKMTGYRFSRWFLPHKYQKRERIVLRNFVECEAHRELMLQGLKYERIVEKKKTSA